MKPEKTAEQIMDEQNIVRYRGTFKKAMEAYADQFRKPDSGCNQYAWQNPKHFLPLEKERAIVVLKAGGREQLVTWNDQSGVFTNSGGTQFKPDQVRFWLPLTALPEIPK